MPKRFSAVNAADKRQNSDGVVGRIMALWTPAISRTCLVIVTLVCLGSFLGKAFNIDDPLFLWSAKHIVSHPLDPYGFQVSWYSSEMPMFAVTKNPPLAAYYAAVAGALGGWSEYTLHAAFFLPALVVVLGVYELSRELTKMPLLAAILTLVAPGFMVSATGCMSDIPMLALWVIAALLWRKGLATDRTLYLAAGALAMGLCALTKYYGICVIPLLFVYTAWKTKRIGKWALYMMVPAGIILMYESWTRLLYGHGLFLEAMTYANQLESGHPASFWKASLTGLSFLGGCALPLLTAVVWLQRNKAFRRTAIAMATLGALTAVLGWLPIPARPDGHGFLTMQIMAGILVGVLVLSLAVSDLKRHLDADSAFLFFWIAGTFAFAAYLNWTINGRSMLPLIPAAAIVGARSLDFALDRRKHPTGLLLALPVLLTAGTGMWITSSDVALANSAREAASEVRRKISGPPENILFTGHWGFQYYMELHGARALDVSKMNYAAGDIIVQPENNTNRISVPEGMVANHEVIAIERRSWVTTMHADRWAGFYSSIWGPLPFSFGPVPAEIYHLIHLR